MEQDFAQIRQAAFDALKAGDFGLAYSRMSEVSHSTAAKLDDAYLAAEWALECSDYAGAIREYSRTIDWSEREREDWYLSAALLGRAYCLLQTGHFELAGSDLSRVPDGSELTWLANHSGITKAQLLRRISSRGGQTS